MCSILFSVSHARCAKTPRHALFSQSVVCASSPGCSSTRTAKLEWVLKGRCPECRPASEAPPASVRSSRENRRQDRDRPSQATHPRPGSENEKETMSSEKAAVRGSPRSGAPRPPAPSTNVQAVEEADAQAAKADSGIEEQQDLSNPAYPPATSQPPNKLRERPPAPRSNVAEPANASLPPKRPLGITPAQKRKDRTRRGQPGTSHEPPTEGHQPRHQPATENPPPTRHAERDASPGSGVHHPRDPRTEPRFRNRYATSSSSSSSSSSSDEPHRRTALETTSAQPQNTFRAPGPSSSSSDPPAPWGPSRTGPAGSGEREREGSAAWGVVLAGDGDLDRG
ncbi:hypothetical protein B0O99DRAFT_600286 [Bisporella sp. PMI_857]|nr:hypothetical protein B0O99DRAFT_600286 [Bisporella sp. PMI_857]